MVVLAVDLESVVLQQQGSDLNLSAIYLAAQIVVVIVESSGYVLEELFPVCKSSRLYSGLETSGTSDFSLCGCSCLYIKARHGECEDIHHVVALQLCFICGAGPGEGGILVHCWKFLSQSQTDEILDELSHRCCP